MISRKNKQPKPLIMAKSVIYQFSLENYSPNHLQWRALPVSTFCYCKARNTRSFSVTDKPKYFLLPSLKGMEQNSAETFPTFLQRSCLHNFSQNGLNLTHLKFKKTQTHIVKEQALQPECHTCLC